MKILVLGSGGMAGHMIRAVLTEKGHSVTGLARKPSKHWETLWADIRDAEKVKGIINSGGYDALINAVGILPGGFGNLHESIWINACFPHFLTEASGDAKVVHLSTDCVFSGEKGGYIENDFRSADDFYGRSKALGELNDEKNLTFRMSIVGPDINERGIGLFNWFMAQKGDVEGYSRAIWSGVTTKVLAEAIDAALAQNLGGLYHLVNNDFITKYELLKLFNGLKKEPNKINPAENPRHDKSMINTRKDFDFTVPSYGDMVEEMGSWIKSRGDLYPHYGGII